MRYTSIITSALITLALAGCQTAAQQQYSAMSGVMQNTAEELKQCATANYNDPRFTSIQPYIPTPANDFMPTMAQKAEDKVPTKAQSALLLQYHAGILPCRKSFITRLANYSPQLANSFVQGIVKADAVFMKLVKRKVSWGQGMQQMEAAILEGQQRVNLAAQQVNNDYQAAHDAELAQRKAASDNLTNWYLQQQAIYEVNAARQREEMLRNRPVNTNCSRLGNSINCTSW
jgi:hypothetical protein